MPKYTRIIACIDILDNFLVTTDPDHEVIVIIQVGDQIAGLHLA
jgi:hypothetical protein